jgi:asparagine synthase (glutamine-hydrolysing)
MCGIIGIGSTKPVLEKSWLKKGSEKLAHRGPDDSGEWWSEDFRVGFAHQRLSILDLSKAGHQPMTNDEFKITITFNGEIYNHNELREGLSSEGFIFKSKSDTEVIIASYKKWGKDCVSHFRGMFAFVIHDQKENLLFFARDRVGEKPLFYHCRNGIIYFSSELKGLLVENKLNKKLDKESLDCFLTFGFVPDTKCILKDFNKLPPAHIMLFSLETGEKNIWRYWNIPLLNKKIDLIKSNENDILENVENLLQNSIRERLIADVPVGILLSGGLDSSLITALATRNNNKVKTFTACFPNSKIHDESKHAKLIAEYFDTEHVELNIELPSPDLIQKLAVQFDEPINDSSMIPMYLISKKIETYCKVAIGGDGGDELFGGYNHYSRLLWMQHYLSNIPQIARRLISKIGQAYLPNGFKSRNWLIALKSDLNSELPLIANYFDKSKRKVLLKNIKEWNYVGEKIFNKNSYFCSDLLQSATRTDFKNFLAEDILVKVDRSSMLNSLEIRAPFLDHRLIEYAFANIPSSLKSSRTDKKILIKKLAKKVLPNNFDFQRKKGFTIPLSSWLKSGPYRDFFYDTLSQKNQIFDNKEIRKMLRDNNRGINNSESLFSIVLFNLWMENYNISL